MTEPLFKSNCQLAYVLAYGHVTQDDDIYDVCSYYCLVPDPHGLGLHTCDTFGRYQVP